MSFVSKNGFRGAGQKRIWSHGDLCRELFRFLWNFIFGLFLKLFWRHHELNLEKRCRMHRLRANLEPRRPVSWAFSICWKFDICLTPFWRHRELYLEKRVPGSRSKANLEPRRPVSWTFLFFCKFWIFGCSPLQARVSYPNNFLTKIDPNETLIS